MKHHLTAAIIALLIMLDGAVACKYYCTSVNINLFTIYSNWKSREWEMGREQETGTGTGIIQEKKLQVQRRDDLKLVRRDPIHKHHQG